MFKVAVVGSTGVDAAGKDIFTVTDYGVYVRDTYDFNDWKEPLGVWNKSRCLSKAEMGVFVSGAIPGSPAHGAFLRYKAQGFVPIFNFSFDNWRKKNGSGGDFVVYSDVEWFSANNTIIRL